MFEWYDFYLYGLLATYISAQFFSGVNETTGFILALAAFGVAWYLTDGDLAALPQRLKTLRLPEWVTLWQAHEPKPGARLI